MVHFVFYAGNAYLKKESGYKNPVGKAVQEGYMQERSDPARSSYSYEDLPSDKFGAKFGATVYNPYSAKTIAQQMADYINNQLHPVDPKRAPNWNEVPQRDPGSGVPPTHQNKSTNPMFIPPNPAPAAQPTSSPQTAAPSPAAKLREKETK